MEGIIMKFISLIIIIFSLFPVNSCSKSSGTDIQDNSDNYLQNENLSENDISGYNKMEEKIEYYTENLTLNNQLKINQDDSLLTKEYEYVYGYEYGIIFDYTDMGKSLKKMQESLYSDSSDNPSNENILLTEDFGYGVFGRGGGDYPKSKEYFFEALTAYQNGELEKAIELIQAALHLYTVSVYYYHYGVFLFDNNDLENAEKAFFKVFQFIYFEDPFYESGVYGRERHPVYTFDLNGAPRERYFTFYNLACIYSIKMQLEKSLDFLIWALEFGYPYIDHLFNDADLENLLSSDDRIKGIINNVYQKGFEDTFAGKAFKYAVRSEITAYSFEAGNTVKCYALASDYKEHTFHGRYIVRNYNVIIDFYEVTGREGIGEGFNAGVSIGYYEYGDMFTKNISKKEMMSITGIVQNNLSWTEIGKIQLLALLN
jgi:tetratricopeptide (TPR) repeat protein